MLPKSDDLKLQSLVALELRKHKTQKYAPSRCHADSLSRFAKPFPRHEKYPFILIKTLNKTWLSLKGQGQCGH